MADASRADVQDPLSPTTIILNALRKAGQQPTNENIRRYVEAMARQTGQTGVDIPGLRIGTPATDAEDQAAMRAAGKGSGRSTPPQSRSTLPADLTHGPTNEADWQPNTAKTTSASPMINTPSTIGARPDLQNVTNIQNATNPAMYAAIPAVPLPPRSATPATPPQVPPPPSTTPWGESTSPWGAPRAPTDIAAQLEQMNARPAPPITPMEAQMRAAMQPPGPEEFIGSNIGNELSDLGRVTDGRGGPPIPVNEPSPRVLNQNVPMPPPDFTIQAPSASSIPPSGGLNIEDRMMPGRGNLTIQAPSAGSIPATQPPVVEETTPILNRIVRGAGTGAGLGRIAGPYGAAIGGVAGAVPGLWDLGKHIVGR